MFGLSINAKMLPWLLAAAGVAFLAYRQHQADTVLDRRHPHAYKG